jgi:hypothetical protein
MFVIQRLYTMTPPFAQVYLFCMFAVAMVCSVTLLVTATSTGPSNILLTKQDFYFLVGVATTMQALGLVMTLMLRRCYTPQEDSVV